MDWLDRVDVEVAPNIIFPFEDDSEDEDSSDFISYDQSFKVFLPLKAVQLSFSLQYWKICFSILVFYSVFDVYDS